MAQRLTFDELPVCRRFSASQRSDGQSSEACRTVITPSEAAAVAAAIAVEQVVLVEANTDSGGRGRLHLHQLNHTWDFDTQIWPIPFELQRSVTNLGMLGQQARTDRMLNALQERRLFSEKCPPNEIFWKLDVETSRHEEGLSGGWTSRSLQDALPGWLATKQSDMTHTYRAARANMILQIASHHLEGDDEDVVALPLHVPRSLTFVRFEMDDVDAIMRFAKPLYADRDKLILAIQQGVRVLWEDANGISWINLELEDQTTYSFFNETFKVGDLEYDRTRLDIEFFPRVRASTLAVQHRRFG